MTRMTKPTSRSSKRGGSPVFTGVLIGLAVGAILAVGVALWATGSNPFKTATVAAPRAVPAPATPAVPEPAPSFDFYKVLPGGAPAEPDLAPAAAPSPRLYLQAGAFLNPNDADNLKAQLAMLGVEAAIQTAEVPDKGVLHRVRIGPFSDAHDVDRMRARLTQNNIVVTLVRETPPSQETP